MSQDLRPGFGEALLGGKKKVFFSEGDYYIEVSSITFQKYAQRVPLGKIIIFQKNIKKFYKKRKKLEHLKSWHLIFFENPRRSARGGVEPFS